MRGGWGLRVGASRNVQVLRCILRCLFIALNRPLKILVGHLPVVLAGVRSTCSIREDIRGLIRQCPELAVTAAREIGWRVEPVS
jgi:hypothetical protein